jgi:DNA-directed RNA polymerase subunit M/transcription elongation factor TFIIS
MRIQEITFCPRCKIALKKQRRGADILYFCSGCGNHVSCEYSKVGWDVYRSITLRTLLRKLQVERSLINQEVAPCVIG